ncbi:MAG TPA: hypothetical protein VNY05_35625 [Candidatus Acidoferrales bacterium]|nr:hypothetical protein [Candidatus Acidoferrales bacterium]
MAEAIAEIVAGLDRLAEVERNLAIQQALLDERLLCVERNRVFTAFNRIEALAMPRWSRVVKYCTREESTRSLTA